MNLLASSITITKNPRIIAATVSKKTTHAQLDDIARLFNTIGGIGGFDHVLHGARHAKERDGDCNRRHHNIAAAIIKRCLQLCTDETRDISGQIGLERRYCVVDLHQTNDKRRDGDQRRD